MNTNRTFARDLRALLTDRDDRVSAGLAWAFILLAAVLAAMLCVAGLAAL